MPYLNVAADGQQPTNIFYTDRGQGRPVLLSHGWPYSSAMFEYQVNVLLREGFRCIAYDRRGFGRSDQPGSGYDYDTLTDDLAKLIEHLDLREVTLLGFSMGGGEVARYFTRHGGKGAVQAVLVSAVTPSMEKTADNPDGVPQKTFDEMMKGMLKDRQHFLTGFQKDFFGYGMLSSPLSDEMFAHFQNVANMASGYATQKCAEAFATTHFEDDCRAISVPTLIIHGKEDQTVPIATAGDRAAKLVPDNIYHAYDGEPHGLFYTARDKFNTDLVTFLRSYHGGPAATQTGNSAEVKPESYV